MQTHRTPPASPFIPLPPLAQFWTAFKPPDVLQTNGSHRLRLTEMDYCCKWTTFQRLPQFAVCRWLITMLGWYKAGRQYKDLIFNRLARLSKYVCFSSKTSHEEACFTVCTSQSPFWIPHSRRDGGILKDCWVFACSHNKLHWKLWEGTNHVDANAASWWLVITFALVH